MSPNRTLIHIYTIPCLYGSKILFALVIEQDKDKSVNFFAVIS